MKRGPQILLGVGIALILIGSLDPLEGSVLILLGSGLGALGTHFGRADIPTRKYWLTILILNAVGVGELWQLSAFGGFGGKSGHTWWWGLLLLPYVMGWLMAIGWILAATGRRLRGMVLPRRTSQT